MGRHIVYARDSHVTRQANRYTMKLAVLLGLIMATVAMAAPAAEPKPEAAAEAEPMCFPWEKCWHQGREAEPAAEVRDAEPKKKKAPKKVHKGREAESEPAAEPRCVDILCPGI